MFNKIFSKQSGKSESNEEKIKKIVSEYKMEFTISLLEGRGFSKPKYIEILNGTLIYMEKSEMGVTVCEAFYCKNGNCESQRGLYNLEFLKEYIYKREKLIDMNLNGYKVNTSHIEFDEIYPNKTGDFIGLLNQYNIEEEILELVNKKGVDPNFSCVRLQLPGNKYLISSNKLNDRRYSYAYLCYGTDLVRFEGSFAIEDLSNKIFEIFMEDIQVKELN